jgi:hypothetical protein
MEFFNYLLKHRCYGILNRELGTCVLNHPHNIDFWKLAAYNEFENGFNTIAARNIFQKCLRLNRRSLEANLEYFVFELQFVYKIMQRRNMLMKEEKKMFFVDSIDGDSKDNKENKERKSSKEGEVDAEPLSDDIMQLKVPELIWLKALDNLKENHNTKEVNFSFLSRLMKYGKELRYKRLKNIIIERLTSEHNGSDLLCNIIKAKLEKYDKPSILLNKAIVKFTKLLTEYPKDINFILSNLVSVVKEDQSKLVPTMLKYLNTEDLINDYDKPYNINIIKFLYDNISAVSSDFNIDSLLDKVITKILNDLAIAPVNNKVVDEYFNLYWKQLFNDSNKFEQIYEYIRDKQIDKASPQSTSFFHIMIKNLCTMVKNEIRIFFEKFSYYVDKIDNLLTSKKIKDLTVVKDIWKYLLEIVIEYKLTTLPNDLSYVKINFDKDYLDAVRLLSTKLSRYLVNFTATLNEIKVK